MFATIARIERLHRHRDEEIALPLVRWEVRLNPSPKGADGTPVDMANIFDGIDKGIGTQ